MLSLNDAVALALENNFDIAIARYNLDIANTDILLAKSGGTVRGVSTGLLTGTPGGQCSVDQHGGLDGQRHRAAPRREPGARPRARAALVLSTQNSVGSPIDSYDPILTGTVSCDRRACTAEFGKSR